MDGSKSATWVLVLGSVASQMAALDALVVATALTEIGRDFDASIEALEWTVNAYTLSFAVLLMTAAVLGDRFGRRRLFGAGLGLFAASSAACALAPDIGWLIAARAVQGAGAALIIPLALAQIGAAFPPERRGRALGIYSAVTALSTVIGPVVGGAVTQGLSWPWIFWLNLPIGLVAMALTFSRLRESFGPRTEPDLLGLLLVSAGVLGLVWGLVRANAAGWTSAETIAALAGGALLVVLFVAWESRAAAPMMPLRLFRLRAFAAGNVAIFLVNGTLMSSIFFMAQFQQAALGQDALQAGLRLLPWGVALVVMAPKAGAVAQRLGEAGAVFLGLTIQAIGLAWLALLASPDLAYLDMVAPMVATGIGFAMALPNVQKAVVGAVSGPEIGRASGTFSMIRQLGGAFGLAIAVAVFASVGGHATPQEFSDGFAAATLVGALLSLGGAIAGLWLPRAVALQPARGRA